MKDKLMFVAEVALAYAAIYAFQQHIYQIPTVGKYLPGGR